MDLALAAATAHVVTTALYAGFQATVRLLVYPQMTAVPDGAFAGYEASHQRRVTLLVGPLFGAVAVTTVVLLVAGVPRAPVLVSGALFLGVLVVTALGAVPQHGRLAAGFDAAAHRRLLGWDAVRLVLAAANVTVAVGLLAAVAG